MEVYNSEVIYFMKHILLPIILLLVMLSLGFWWLTSDRTAVPEDNMVQVAFTTSDDCETVGLFLRPVSGSQSLAHTSLVELLKGPTAEEKDMRASTQIPPGVKINTVRQEGNTIYADFDETLDRGVAGSCRVLAIRSQITNTLKQFPGINNVVISINGRTDDILQP